MVQPMGRTPSVDLLVGPVHEVAPRLLNTLLQVGGRVGRIVEVEAYGGKDDSASHAARGPTPRNATMFASAGRLYVYRSYGVHWCANVVTGTEGDASAVLVRAVEPVLGIELMWGDRPRARRHEDLTNGPGKLCAALGIGAADDGTDLFDLSAGVQLLEDGVQPPLSPEVTSRVGISRAVDRLWRFSVPGNPWVSRGHPSGG